MADTTIRAVAFDWGGVFTEGTFDSSAVRELSSCTALTEDEIGASYYPLMAEFEAGAFDFSEFTRRFLQRTGAGLSEEEFKGVFLHAVRDRPAMFELLAALPAHYRLGMLSNNVPLLCDRVREDARLGRIRHFLFSNELGVRKPDARAFAALTAALDVPPEATLFIDDNADNIAACRRLGYHGLLLGGFDSFLAEWRRLLPDATPAALL